MLECVDRGTSYTTDRWPYSAVDLNVVVNQVGFSPEGNRRKKLVLPCRSNSA